MVDFLSDPHTWESLVTLTALEIVLGIDNVIFLSIATSRLPRERQPLARSIGLLLAFLMRVVMLSAIVWIISLATPIVTIWGEAISWRDVVLAAGGLFLLTKGTREIHLEMEGGEEEHGGKAASLLGVIVQIAVLDIVFSLDSVITAVGMAEHLSVMIGAVAIAILVMLAAADSVSKFVNQHPTVKMLALSFLLLIGVALIADGAHFHIPRAYLYFAVAFSAGVEILNQLATRSRARRKLRKS
ncbi:MAG TPA: TerC family protein [Rhizomicrobium sp.]|jgi:predicted tellurium resistance membrane protein TerC|nr:TerC family protein [Rhizomicrobium sp.]